MNRVSALASQAVEMFNLSSEMRRKNLTSTPPENSIDVVVVDVGSWGDN